jgi:hypothetical protein
VISPFTASDREAPRFAARSSSLAHDSGGRLIDRVTRLSGFGLRLEPGRFPPLVGFGVMAISSPSIFLRDRWALRLQPFQPVGFYQRLSEDHPLQQNEPQSPVLMSIFLDRFWAATKTRLKF